MDAPPDTASPPTGRPGPRRLLLGGLIGLLLATALAGILEGALRALGVEGRVPTAYFVAIAALAPVLALGLLAQLVTALAGRASALLREVKRFDQEMSAEPPELNLESHHARLTASEAGELFLRVVVPFEAALALQFLVTEAVAILCIAREVHERVVAIALGIEVAALFVSLLFFNVMLRRFSRSHRRT